MLSRAEGEMAANLHPAEDEISCSYCGKPIELHAYIKASCNRPSCGEHTYHVW